MIQQGSFMLKHLRNSFVIVVCCTSLGAYSLEQDRVLRLMDEVKQGTPIYYSPEAVLILSGSQGEIAPQSQNHRENALKGINACISLAQIGPSARASIPTLIELFPKAIHAVTIQNAIYSGEGSFDDWLSTYVMTEKNKFILTSPFVDYNSMSFCEQFIEASPKVKYINRKSTSKGVITSATVNIDITFSFNVGACALTKITNNDIGTSNEAWRNWWTVNASMWQGINSALGQDASTSSKLFSDILVGGKYQIVLESGDSYTGTIEAKTDTSIILETAEGKPYAFNDKIIKTFEIIAPPKDKGVKSPTQKETLLTYEKLQQQSIGTTVEIKISNGTLFSGSLHSINAEQVQLNISGSFIPISKDVIQTISLVPIKVDSTKIVKATPSTNQSYDTIIQVNPVVDDYGKPLKDLIFIGRIVSEQGNKIRIDLIDGSSKIIDISTIKRMNKHTTNDYELQIKQYAKPLFCPSDMFLVDMPPGKANKPFFKVCIDRYEYPNRNGEVPKVGVSFTDAIDLCKQAGKRLCTSEEWQWACSGVEGYTYPYGHNFDNNICNSDTRIIEPSNSRINCISKFGGYDMTGNVFEWVIDSKNNPALMGGAFSKCQTISPGGNGSAKPQSGFRCCKSN